MIKKPLFSAGIDQFFTDVSQGSAFAIRFYPAVARATINSTAKTYQELGNSGFAKLANYKLEKILKTSSIAYYGSFRFWDTILPINYWAEKMKSS